MFPPSLKALLYLYMRTTYPFGWGKTGKSLSMILSVFPLVQWNTIFFGALNQIFLDVIRCYCMMHFQINSHMIAQHFPCLPKFSNAEITQQWHYVIYKFLLHFFKNYNQGFVWNLEFNFYVSLLCPRCDSFPHQFLINFLIINI